MSTMNSIYGLTRQPGEVCVKIPYRGFEISLVLDDSHTGGHNLIRTYLRVFSGEQDLTNQFYGVDEVVAVTSDELHDAFRLIDKRFGD